ncbi:hypothetical protein CXF83_07575 [Shewanella sp. Choline-02u-19]|uniref:DUF998 domain-containing protein n=1 Tax=unclassified Shewanella TaxID=196818 RepID=UPI000C33D369|nr:MULTISPECIES: DUF998 domain-containing protein [unclassified Shewanella]PKG57906.1 hypothetical protein CXF82_07220 [Shewanella sp. GutDb-MelDb]PKG75071.1 hypothetical protein CXF86_08755 [Shewanella sp. GutCb]PKH54838.1 hypothetical protein CXF84_18555 [Shewanella sp. Bg11-22]PKI26610.1 hypothetical protein CXF83_07575 [Shewanella sp. Choline-02u-19]
MVARTNNKVSTLAFRFGMLGIFGLLLGLMLSVLTFKMYDGEGFSFLNHTLSELGHYGHSDFAVIINGGLFFGSLSAVLFCLFSLQIADSSWSYPFFACLGLTFFCLAAVGLFPINVYHLHIVAIKYFFIFGSVSSMFYGLYLFVGRGRLFSRSTSVLAIIAFVNMSAFLLVPLLGLELTEGGRAFYHELLVEMHRPAIWWPAIFEWVGIASFVAWSASVMLSLRPRVS